MGSNNCGGNIYFSCRNAETDEIACSAIIICCTEGPHYHSPFFKNSAGRKYNACQYISRDTGYSIVGISNDVRINVFQEHQHDKSEKREGRTSVD